MNTKPRYVENMVELLVSYFHSEFHDVIDLLAFPFQKTSDFKEQVRSGIEEHLGISYEQATVLGVKRATDVFPPQWLTRLNSKFGDDNFQTIPGTYARIHLRISQTTANAIFSIEGYTAFDQIN